MGYFIDAEATDLSALEMRLQGTDLIPSQAPLLDGVSKKLGALEAAGIQNLADLKSALKTANSLDALSAKSGVGSDYLLLLRRTINGFFPKPRRFAAMGWLSETAQQALQQAGLGNTQQLFEADPDQVPALAGLDKESMLELLAVSDLCRVQWVSPNYARALVAAGFTTASKVAGADPKTLAAALENANQGAKFYRGKVGLRDIRRLVAVAKYVP